MMGSGDEDVLGDAEMGFGEIRLGLGSLGYG